MHGPAWLLDLYNQDQATTKVRILQEASGWKNLPPNSQKLTMLLALHSRMTLLSGPSEEMLAMSSVVEMCQI